MFLSKTRKYNAALIEQTIKLHQDNKLLPDSYIIDVDTFISNAKLMLTEAKASKIDLYFMLKQVGRNPYLAKKLIEIGYKGAVVVDFKEAQLMMQHQIPIANVGHLVQVPKALIKELVAYNCEYFTVYSLAKIKEINAAAQDLGKKQKIMLRVVSNEDMIYSGQYAGFSQNEIVELSAEINKLDNIELAGLTSFPCFIYDHNNQALKPTNNLNTILETQVLLNSLGFCDLNINAPSATSIATLQLMKDYPINSAEPGHGLSGSTPISAMIDTIEKPCVIYLSEISHNFNNKGYCYGGGLYRRGHLQYALVGKDYNNIKELSVISPDLDSIDYHFGLSSECCVSDTVIMAFRFQIFVTRSDVYLIENIKSNPIIVGHYDSLGRKKNG
ncbi:MAG: alanine racemase [Erysipelotrichaceae bacterium]